MGKGNKKCICCGKEYTFCLHCAEYDHFPRWMNIYHNENCKNLFNITTEYKAGNITAKEAKDGYSKCDLSYKNKLNKYIVDVINEVNRLTKKNTSKKEKQYIKTEDVEVDIVEELNVKVCVDEEICVAEEIEFIEEVDNTEYSFNK